MTHIVYIQREVNATNETNDSKIVEDVAKSTDESLRGMVTKTLAYWKYRNTEKNKKNRYCKTVEMTKYLPDSRPFVYTQWALVDKKDIKRCMPIIQIFLYLKRSKTMKNTMILRFRRAIVGYEALKVVAT